MCSEDQIKPPIQNLIDPKSVVREKLWNRMQYVQ